MSFNPSFRRAVSVALALGVVLVTNYRDVRAECERPSSNPASGAQVSVGALNLHGTRRRLMVISGSGASSNCTPRQERGLVLSLQRTTSEWGYLWGHLSPRDEGSSAIRLQDPSDETVTVTLENSESLKFQLNSRARSANDLGALPFDWVSRSRFVAHSAPPTRRAFAAPDFSAQVKLFEAEEQRVSIDWGKSSRGIEKGLTLSFDKAHESLERLSFHTKIIRAEDGSRRYVVGLQNERLRIKHHTKFAIAVGETGTGGLGTTIGWSRDSLKSDSGVALGVAAGDEGVSAVFRIKKLY